MARALQLRGIRKRFVAGAGCCLASADVLRGIDLDVDSGESVAVVGASGSGKSTLMLCAAGLLRADAGTAIWYGDSGPVAAAARTHYCFSVSDLASLGRSDDGRLYLIDLPSTVRSSSALADWVDERCESGSSVIVATRDERPIHRVVDRILVLAGGILHATRTVQSRVAESVVGEASPFC